jgi:hypothetical protein
MEGWRQGRLGSRAGTHREKEENKNILIGKEKKKNILDTRRPSHGRTEQIAARRHLVYSSGPLCYGTADGNQNRN